MLREMNGDLRHVFGVYASECDPSEILEHQVARLGRGGLC